MKQDSDSEPSTPKAPAFSTAALLAELAVLTREDSGALQDLPAGHWGRLVPCNPAISPLILVAPKLKYTIGRGDGNDFVVNYPKISGSHCIITYINEADGTDSVDIQDLSSNGTYWTPRSTAARCLREGIYGLHTVMRSG